MQAHSSGLMFMKIVNGLRGNNDLHLSLFAMTYLMHKLFINLIAQIDSNIKLAKQL